jgi:adenylylsulfate kinase
MYKKARAGIIRDFTGISAPYQPPEKPEVHLHTDQLTVGECVHAIMDYLMQHNYIPCSPNSIQTTYRAGVSP